MENNTKMTDLDGRIDFILTFTATDANPNGDPLKENEPRTDLDGYGRMSQECAKRKIRNRMQALLPESGSIYVQSEDRSDDGCNSLSERKDKVPEMVEAIKKSDKEALRETACRKWADVRAFGQVFAFKGESLSCGIRGPVTIQNIKSVSPVNITTMQITKSVNGENKNGKTEDGESSMAADRMGKRSFVDFGLYVLKGSISCQLADLTGFSKEDAALLKECLKTLFVDDESAARPAGSMEVRDLYWWEHQSRLPKASAGEVFRGVTITEKADYPKSYDDYEIALKNPEECVEPEVYHF